MVKMAREPEPGKRRRAARGAGPGPSAALPVAMATAGAANSRRARLTERTPGSSRGQGAAAAAVAAAGSSLHLGTAASTLRVSAERRSATPWTSWYCARSGHAASTPSQCRRGACAAERLGAPWFPRLEAEAREGLGFWFGVFRVWGPKALS